MEFPFLWELWEFLPLVWLQVSCNRNVHYHTLWSIFKTFNCLERKYSFLNERLNHPCPNYLPPPHSPHHHLPPPSKIHGAPLTWQEWSKIWDISHPIIMDNLFSLLKIYATAKTNTCYRVQIPKVFNTINCTCTIPSISDISRLACAHVWSVCVITRSVNVAFLRSCFALVRICRENQQISQRKEEKYNEIENTVLTWL